MLNLEKSAQFGNTQGQPFDDLEAAIDLNKPVTGFNMRSGNIIDSIQAVYGANSTPAHGGAGGAAATVTIDPGDYLTGISGVTGNWFGPVFVLRLEFQTHLGKVHSTPANAVFGDMDYSSNQTPFSITAPEGMQIRALYGTTFATNNGQLTVLASLGAYFHIAPVQAGTDKKLQRGLEIYCGNIFTGGATPSCALIVCTQTLSKGVAAYQLSYYSYGGSAGTPPVPTTNFCIGSVTKSFTGSLLAARILGGEGYSINAKLADYLPLSNVPAGNRILNTTLGQLATHTACFAPNCPDEDHGLYNGSPSSTAADLNPSEGQIQQWLNKNPTPNWLPGCTVGADQNYSNWGFKTLAFAVCQPRPPATLYNYDPVLRQNINHLFLLTNTNTKWSTTVPAGYVCKQGALKLADGYANGIRSSLQDMANFAACYLVGLSQAPNDPAASLLARTVQLAVQQPYAAQGVTNALGWGLSTPDGLQTSKKPKEKNVLISKNGSTPQQGYSAWIGLLPAVYGGAYQQAAVVVLVNCAGPQALAPVQKQWLGEDMGAKPQNLGQLVLKYLITPDGDISGFTPAALPDDDDSDD